eukprot:scaffold7708_cov175-Skeletonema_menzelii.AAC.1
MAQLSVVRHAVGLGTEIKAKFSPKYFFARLVFIFGGMPSLSNLWTGMHFFHRLRCQNIILKKCIPSTTEQTIDGRIHPNIITIIHSTATATLLAARHRFVSFDWLKYNGERRHHRQDSVIGRAVRGRQISSR